MKINKQHRKKLKYYLDEFYNRYPSEKYTVFHFVRYFKQRLKNNKDAWVGVCGQTGEGKTLFTILSMILFGRPMSLTKNIAYVPTGNEIMEMFDKLNFQCLLIDEAAREMRAVNWQSKQQQGVNVKAMTDRFKNNLVFLNMPYFNEFTKSMRRGNLQFRCIIAYRTENYARVIVQRKSRNWRNDDPWGDDEADKKYIKIEKKFKDIDNEIILNIERSLPQTIMDFIVPNLELILPDVTEEYEKNKQESRKKAVEDDPQFKKTAKYKEELNAYKHRIAHLIYYNKIGLGQIKLSQKEMAEALGVSIDKMKKLVSTPLPEKKPAFREEVKKEKENPNLPTLV